MKIRNGFVSNSSSSSFIIAIAAVKDIAKFDKYMKDNKLKDSELHIMTYGEIKENRPYDIEKVTDKELTIESFAYSTVSVKPENLKDRDSVVFYYYCGNEGDYAFCDQGDDPWDSYPEYDISSSFFDTMPKAIMDMFFDPEASGLDKDNCQCTYGAARNG